MSHKWSGTDTILVNHPVQTLFRLQPFWYYSQTWMVEHWNCKYQCLWFEFYMSTLRKKQLRQAKKTCLNSKMTEQWIKSFAQYTYLNILNIMKLKKTKTNYSFNVTKNFASWRYPKYNQLRVSLPRISTITRGDGGKKWKWCPSLPK